MPALRIEIDTARPQDAEHVLRLVEENRLTADGLLDALATILVARLDQRIVGTAALEIYADGALLRSVAVSADIRRRGLGASLINAALGIADDLKVHDVFLLTFSAQTSRTEERTMWAGQDRWNRKHWTDAQARASGSGGHR